MTAPDPTGLTGLTGLTDATNAVDSDVDLRIARTRTAASIACLALQQVDRELGDLADQVAARATDQSAAQEVLAEILRELFREDTPGDGVLGTLAQVLTTAGTAATCIDTMAGGGTEVATDDDSGTACLLLEAASDIGDSAGMRLHDATRTLHPAGEPPTRLTWLEA